MSDQEIEKLARERTEEIEFRTPHVTTWQVFYWPVHCGDYCCFIGEVGREDLNSLSPEGNGRAFLSTVLFVMTKEGEQTIDEENEENLDWLWEYIPSHAPRKGTKDRCGPIFLFQCLHCDKYLSILDFD